MMGKSMFIIMNTQCLKLMFLPLTNLTITHVNYYHRRQDISQKVLVKFSCTFVEGLAIDQGPTHYILVENWMKILYKSVCKLFCVAETNEKIVNCTHYPNILCKL